MACGRPSVCGTGQPQFVVQPICMPEGVILMLLLDSTNGLRALALDHGAAVEYYQLSSAGGWKERWSLLVIIHFQCFSFFDIRCTIATIPLQQRVYELRSSSLEAHPGIFALTGAHTSCFFLQKYFC